MDTEVTKGKKGIIYVDRFARTVTSQNHRCCMEPVERVWSEKWPFSGMSMLRNVNEVWHYIILNFQLGNSCVNLLTATMLLLLLLWCNALIVVGFKYLL
jgi:hypothetical protein